MSDTSAVIEVEAAGFSETGPRETNEDFLGAHQPADPALLGRKGCLFALADGVGGHAAGEVASRTAVETLVAEYYSPSNHGRVEPALRHAVQTANLRVHDAAMRNPELRSMSTTLTALALAGTSAYVAHVGDTRCYHWRAGKLQLLTSDHSEAADLVRMRLASADKLREHPRRNILTRTIGGKLLLRPDFLRQPIEPEDRFLLCCDGLWAEYDDDEISARLGEGTAEDACRALVGEALRRGATDNVTAQVVRVVAVAPEADTGSGRGWLAGIFGRNR